MKKFNWAYGIVIGMVAFMVFILQYVIRVQTDKSMDNELVTENYYQEEINIDKNYDAQKNAQGLGNEFRIEKVTDGLVIHFPQKWQKEMVSGTIELYKPSDMKQDKKIPIQLPESKAILINKEQLSTGNWEISVHCLYDGKNYLLKQSISL